MDAEAPAERNARMLILEKPTLSPANDPWGTNNAYEDLWLMERGIDEWCRDVYWQASKCIDRGSGFGSLLRLPKLAKPHAPRAELHADGTDEEYVA